jgi:hypothetical protein
MVFEADSGRGPLMEEMVRVSCTRIKDAGNLTSHPESSQS